MFYASRSHVKGPGVFEHAQFGGHKLALLPIHLKLTQLYELLWGNPLQMRRARGLPWRCCSNCRSHTNPSNYLRERREGEQEPMDDVVCTCKRDAKTLV
jgi:hypothetical protein